MPYFVIFGKPNCPNYAHAAFVAQYLSERLPNFFYKKIEKFSKDWAIYLDDLNRQNKWYMSDSPIVWKELNRWGGKKYLLGGLSEFWEHVYSYYGLESLIAKPILMELAGDNLKFSQDKAQIAETKNFQYITILGASDPVSCFLVNDMLQIKGLRKADGMVFKFYDHHSAMDDEKYSAVVDCVVCLNDTKHFGSHDLVKLCETKEDAITNADIIIHLEDFLERKEEEDVEWLERCNYRMKIFADILCAYGKRTAKIILAGNGPVCYVATCLWIACAKKFPHIVAVTANKGFPYIKCVSDKTGIPVDRISAPAVWGQVGVGFNSFVDVKNMLYRAEVYRPYKRSLTAPKGSTLPLGVIKSEIRLISFLIKDSREIEQKVEEREEKMFDKIKRSSIFSKLRSTISLLKLWHNEEIGDEIISLGVPSNGTFGIPEDIVFSQPVKLNESRTWVPYANFPLMDNETKTKINHVIHDTKRILAKVGLVDETELSSYEEQVVDDYQKYLDSLEVQGEQHTDLDDYQSDANSLFTSERVIN